MKWDLAAIEPRVTADPAAWGTVTDRLPCPSESDFVDVRLCALRPRLANFPVASHLEGRESSP
jgi:hypothetical protein